MIKMKIILFIFDVFNTFLLKMFIIKLFGQSSQMESRAHELFSAQEPIKGAAKEKNGQKCVHCLKFLSQWRIKDHQKRCKAANLELPEEYKIQRINGKLIYFCECGYHSRRDRLFTHIQKCSQKRQTASTHPSLPPQIQVFSQPAVAAATELEIAPVMSISSQPAQEIEKNQNFQNFDPHLHPKFSQFRQAQDDAPLLDLQNRYKIFSISLLLRFTGSFDNNLKVWSKGRCKKVRTDRFLAQLNSKSSIFRGSTRTLDDIRSDLKDVALVDNDVITIFSFEGLIHQLKQSLEHYQYCAIWHLAYVAPLIQKKKKRAPRAHWQTLKLRRYIAKVRYRNKKWGVNLRPSTLERMRERSVMSEHTNSAYLLKFHMNRPTPRFHKRQFFRKKDELMINYAIHRIADAFTADFYVDYMRLQMKIGCGGDGFEEGSTVNIFQSQQQYEEWKKRVTKQLPTTCIWIPVPKFYLENRKSLMSALYYSCQDRFRRRLPSKTDQEIYLLVVKWYESNFLIDQDDWRELKKYIEDRDEYENKIKRDIDRVHHPEIVVEYTDMIDQQAPEEPPQPEIEIRITLPKPTSRFFSPKLNVELFTQEEILRKDCLFQLKNHPKEFDDFQKCCLISCKRWLNGQIYDCVKCNASYHPQCWPKDDFCPVCKLMNDSLGFSTSLPSSVSLLLSKFPQQTSFLTAPIEPLLPEAEKEAINNIERHLYKQQYCVYNVFHESFSVYPFYNSTLKKLHPADQQILDYYAQEGAFPVVVRAISPTKGNGLVARRPIKKGELVSTYSGNVMSLSQISKYGEKKINEYTFQLIFGPDVLSNYAVYPRDFASAGFFMNHSSSKCKRSKVNVRTIMMISRMGPIILMQATKKINYGEELLYDYNGKFDSYNTEGFQ